MTAAVIIYIVYFIYLLTFLVDWTLILNEENSTWFLGLLIISLLAITCFFTALYVTGKDILGINGFCFGLVISVLLIILGLVFYYEYYKSSFVVDKAVQKIQKKEYPDIFYQYGRSHAEIVNKINPDIIPYDEYHIQHLMLGVSDNKIDTILPLYKKEKEQVKYDLLWYLALSEDPFSNRLTKKEIEHILLMKNEQLLSLLGNNYRGCTNRACLLFTCLSGQIIPDINVDKERFEQILKYNSKVVYNLAFIQNKMINHVDGTYIVQGPYIYLSTVKPSPIENIIIDLINTKNHNETINKFGLVQPSNFNSLSNDEKIDYLQGELSLYHEVIDRPKTVKTPPNLNGKSRDDIVHILLKYTNKELISYYEPRHGWNTRAELISTICSDVLGINTWSIHSKSYCTNDESMNIITGELHSDTSKYDDNDPTLSYGTHKNYRCYQVSELEACFREYDTVFMFAVPDWLPTSEFPRQFPLESIKQLKTLLEKERFNSGNLLNKINEGLEFMNSAQMRIRSLRNEFDKFTFEQKEIVELYLSWMFTYSMWMRFWKGPGYNWPLIKVNVTRVLDRSLAQRASPQERD
jgi:hypothetical protein